MRGAEYKKNRRENVLPRMTSKLQILFCGPWSITIDNSNNNKTFEMINVISENDIIDTHTRFSNRYRLRVNEENKYLPHIYWLPKLHKNPTKTRLIITAPKCSLKPLSNL